MGTKPTYDKETILLVFAEYFFTHNENDFLSLSLERVYSDIISYASESAIHQKVKFPKYSQMRKILISELTENGEYSQGERLTTAVAYRITKNYTCYDSDDIESLLYHNRYNVSMYSGSVIICTIKLPSEEVLDILAESIGEAKNESVTWSRVNIIQRLCKNMKNKNPKVILAVIPQYNRMVYLNSNGKISKQTDKFNPICDSVCMFVKNTPEGRKFIEEHKFPVFPYLSERKGK